MNDTLKLIETRTINDALVNGYYGKKEAWFTRDEIGSVLGYADPRQSIANIHNRHKERFSDKSVQINLICTDGKAMTLPFIISRALWRFVVGVSNRKPI